MHGMLLIHRNIQNTFLRGGFRPVYLVIYGGILNDTLKLPIVAYMILFGLILLLIAIIVESLYKQQS